jgi:hypothetical protein
MYHQAYWRDALGLGLNLIGVSEVAYCWLHQNLLLHVTVF